MTSGNTEAKRRIHKCNAYFRLWKAGLIVLIVDMFKGWLAVNLIHLTHFYIPETGKFITFQLMLGVAAILGHIFPVYVGFEGGKGVATLFGLVMAINPEPTLICTGIFERASIASTDSGWPSLSVRNGTCKLSRVNPDTRK